MKLNKIYYRNLIKSAAIVIIGLGLTLREIKAMGAVSENYFILIMGILCTFFGFLGIITLLMRFNKIRFRRKFIFAFSGVANFCIGGFSIFYSIKYKPTLPFILIYVFSFLVGVVILADIFFGKRAPSKFEREVLID